MRRIYVGAPSGHYAVLCGRGVIARAGRLVSQLGETTGRYVLSSPRVWRYWGSALEASLAPAGYSPTILFDDRERAKNLCTVEWVCRELVRRGADRGAVIVALGGGVVGDVAGFVAACYLRGVRLVHVPTTLVAQVDSAIGGKTGVNLPEGKNLVGAFYQPRLVLVDPDVLSTLPAREYRAGIYEVIKYGVIGDAALFRYLERNLDRLLRREPAVLEWVLPRCIRAKADVVARDEREAGLRAILNLGHTFGHALEAATRYKRYLHGEAVGWGMVAATALGVALDRFDERAAARVIRLVLAVGPLPSLPAVGPERLLEVMRADKKARGGRLRFVLPVRIGAVAVKHRVPERLVRKVWAELPSLADHAGIA